MAPTTVGLPPIDSDARSCEVLLEDGTANVVGARFGASVQGEQVRQAPRTAITFFSAADAPIGSSAVQVETLGDGRFRIVSAQCFDKNGHPIAGGGMPVDG